MSSSWVSLAEIMRQLEAPLSDAELAEFSRLSTALAHAIHVAREMPTTLDARARALIVTKLQEAEHWSFELLRAAGRERSG